MIGKVKPDPARRDHWKWNLAAHLASVVNRSGEIMVLVDAGVKRPGSLVGSYDWEPFCNRPLFVSGLGFFKLGKIVGSISFGQLKPLGISVICERRPAKIHHGLRFENLGWNNRQIGRSYHGQIALFAGRDVGKRAAWPGPEFDLIRSVAGWVVERSRSPVKTRRAAGCNSTGVALIKL